MDHPPSSAAGPEAMRARLADYVAALHGAYLRQAGLLAPAERAALPLAPGRLMTVAVAAARDLHLIATTEPLPPPRGPEVELAGEFEGTRWTVRFFDATILPELGLPELGREGTGDEAAAVRRILGVADVLYHVSVSTGGGLGEHHAQHAGVALANQHADAARDARALRHAWRGRESLVDEFVTTERLGLTHAARLVARELAGDMLTADDLTSDLATLRKALVRLGKGGRP